MRASQPLASQLIPPAVAADASPAPFDDTIWQRLLATYVAGDGRVAYRDLQEKDAAAFERYLAQLAAAQPDDWPRPAQIAFWINAYNAGLVSAVLQGRTAEPAIGRVKLFKFWKFRVAGRNRSPDEIEHQILRMRFHELRIHFAIVCASTSCPKLRRSAYSADSLDTQLDDQARRFIDDPSRNVIDPASQKLKISMIFDWFHEDFERAAGSVPRFLARYVSSAAARRWLESSPPKPEHLDYDWSLNAQPGQRPRGM